MKSENKSYSYSINKFGDLPPEKESKYNIVKRGVINGQGSYSATGGKDNSASFLLNTTEGQTSVE